MPQPKKPKPTTTADPGRRIDLDQARAERDAARSEADRKPVMLRLGGQDFPLPVELPIDFALHAQQGDMRGAVEALLGENADAFFEQRPTLDDFEAIAEQARDVYGITEGKSEASPTS